MEKGLADKFDIIIIGAGVAGAAVARELSRYQLSVGVLEKEVDVSFGASKATHGLIHCGGFSGSDTPLKSRGELVGNLKMEQLCKDLDVKFERIGKLLVAFNKKEEERLKELETIAHRAGVLGAEFIKDSSRIKEMEPELSEDVISVLHTPSTGVAAPWSLVIGLMENAMDNGVELYVNTLVEDIESTEEGILLKTSKGDIKSSYVINAAGLNAEKIARMVGDDSFEISGSRQQRIIMDKHCEDMVNHVVRGLNDEGCPVGNFVFPTVDGDIMVGCHVDGGDYYADVKTTREGLEKEVIPEYQKFIPSLTQDNSIKPFAGYIPMTKKGDYHIKPAAGTPRFVNMVLGGSGFTSSPEMVEYLVHEVLPEVGIELKEDPEFDPYREDIPHIEEMDNEERAELIAKDPRYGHVVCRCEKVSEGEIVEAIRRGARTRDGVKFRTRAGMGRCQGGFCRPRVLRILSRELDKPVEEITLKGNGSREVHYKTKELLKAEGDVK